MAGQKEQKPHAIMVSFHLQGHIIPFINLAIKLASRGFPITFAHLDFVHHQISHSQNDDAQTDIFTAAHTSGLDIRYTTFSDGFPLVFDRAYDAEYLKFFRDGLVNKVDELVGNILESDSSTTASNYYFLIADTICIWPEKIARKYGLLSVSFWTQPALVFSLCYHWELLRERGTVPVNGRRDIVDYVPGIKSINTADFMSYLHGTEWKVIHDVIHKAFTAVRSADLILCNTVQELEAETISALQQKHPFYSIGPLFPADFVERSISQSLLPESNSGDWLNSKPAGSVLYISFGSLSKADEKLIAEIADGILLTGVNFIWVVRPGMVDLSGGGEVLPEGFKDQTRERGLVVPWCSQNEVLRNPAIGGFLTHCGWNSVWCGVPMICYPLFADQITNRKLVVDDWRVGINLCDGGSISKEEVAEKIEIVMSEERSEELRRQIQKVRKTFQNAVSVGGSSENNFDRFVDEILTRCS